MSIKQEEIKERLDKINTVLNKIKEETDGFWERQNEYERSLRRTKH